MLTSLGKQQRSVWVGLCQLGLMIILFFTLWGKYQLLGAVLAIGVSTMASNVILLVTARYSGPIRFPIGKDYLSAIMVGSVTGLAAIRLQPLGAIGGLIGSCVAVTSFLLLAGYRWQELRDLATCILPEFGWSDRDKAIR